MNIKVGQTIKTKGGDDVEVIYVVTDGRALELGDVIVGIRTDKEGDRAVESWQRNGKFSTNGIFSGLDLVMP